MIIARRNVHTVGHWCEAVFDLNCPGGPMSSARTTDSRGVRSGTFLPVLTSTWTEMCQAWGQIHGIGVTIFERARPGMLKDGRPRFPRALSPRYDHKTDDVLHLQLQADRELSRPVDVEGLEDARPLQLIIEISPQGFGITTSRWMRISMSRVFLEGFSWAQDVDWLQIRSTGGRSSSRLRRPPQSEWKTGEAGQKSG